MMGTDEVTRDDGDERANCHHKQLLAGQGPLTFSGRKFFFCFCH
jgi:hypothetical protein